MRPVLQIGKKSQSKMMKMLKSAAGLAKKKGISLSEMLAELDEVRHSKSCAGVMKMTGKYKADFIKRMEEAEADLNNDNFKISSTEEFLKSLK